MQFYVITDTEAGPIASLSVASRNNEPSKLKEAIKQSIESFHDCTVINLQLSGALKYTFESDSEFIESGEVELTPVANYSI